jgi:hypothetical protein
MEARMKTFTASQASKRFGEVLRVADNELVQITRYGGRCRFVLASAQVYEALALIAKAHSENRVLVSMQSAVGRLMGSDEEDGIRRLRASSAMLQRFLSATGEKL